MTSAAAPRKEAGIGDVDTPARPPGTKNPDAAMRRRAASADVPTVTENAVWPFAVAATFEGVTHGPGNASVLVQVRLGLPVNPPIEVRSSEYVAVVPPETVTVAPPLAAGPNSKSAADPVSFTLVCAFVAEFDAITSVPLREGDCVLVPGSNATEIVHVPAAATGLPHPFVTTKSVESVTVAEETESIAGAAAVLVTVNCSGSLCVFASCPPNPKDAGDTPICAATALPLTAMDCGLFGALSVI